MLTVVIPLYEGVTHLDFTGPQQFLDAVPDLQVIVASLDGTPITAHGLTFSQLADLESIEQCDILCVPGGLGCVNAIENSRFMAEIKRLADMADYQTAVCTGSVILAAAGLLKGKRAACHWGFREILSEFGAIPEASRVVRDGHVITGGGVTAGIDFALTLIAELKGIEMAEYIQLMLEYAPQPPFNSGRPELAREALLTQTNQRMNVELAPIFNRIKAVAASL